MADLKIDGLEEQPQPHSTQKAIIDVKDEWPWYQRLAGNIINTLPAVLWVVVTYLLLASFGVNPELAGYGAAYMNLVVRASAYGILSLISAVTLVSWANPWFHPAKLMRGDSNQQLACAIIWASTIIGIALVIAGAR